MRITNKATLRFAKQKLKRRQSAGTGKKSDAGESIAGFYPLSLLYPLDKRV